MSPPAPSAAPAPAHEPSHQQLALLAGLALSAGPVFAQAWPTKPVTLVVPFPAGGTTDVLARAMAPLLAARLRTTVVVENRVGGATLIGSAAVATTVPSA